MFLFLSFIFFILQDGRTGGPNRVREGGPGGRGELVGKGIGE
jgi:hypothetical protein